jgi:hypothetical protein
MTGSCSNPVPAPLATLLGDPPGKWNNNGGLQVNSDCIPLSNTIFNAIGIPYLENPSEPLYKLPAISWQQM